MNNSLLFRNINICSYKFMSYGNVIISFLKIISWYFSSLFIKGFAFLRGINIFERLGLDSRKKNP